MNNSSLKFFRRPSMSSRVITYEMEVYIYLATLVIGIIGNGLVLCSVATRRRRRLTANDIFILNLAVSDLLLLMIFLPFSIYIRLATFKPTVFVCKFTAPIITVALGGTIFTLAVMAVQRCLVITQPFRQEMTVKAASLAILCIWFLSMALSFPKIINAKPVRNKCIVYWKYPFHRHVYTASLFVVRFAIPFIVIVISYVKMGITLLRSQSPRFTTDSSGNIRNITNRRENMAVVKTLVLISAVFLVCMLPYRVSLLLIMFGRNRNSNVMNVYSTSAILTIAHSCINPIIYGAFLKQFSDDYKRLILNFLFCKICTKKQQPSRENTDRSDGLELREEDGLSSPIWKNKTEIKTVQQVTLLKNDYRRKGEETISMIV